MKTLRITLKNTFLGLALSSGFLPGFLAWDAHAEINKTVSMADFTSYPVITTESATPQVIVATCTAGRRCWNAPESDVLWRGRDGGD